MEFIIVTGMSGAGKSTAIKTLEDLGIFCVDNLPASLIPTVAELCAHSGRRVERVAFVTDVREGEFLGPLDEVLLSLREQGHAVRILFLEADDQVLLRRFSESRRPHPLAPQGSVLQGISLERQRMAQLKVDADMVLNTGDLTIHDLRRLLVSTFRDDRPDSKTAITLVSFGYRYGIPPEADLVFDLRCLPNPHFHEELRPLTGCDPRVSKFILEDPSARSYLDQLWDFLCFTFPYYLQEGRAYLTIALGCTGGRHRSVTAAEHLGRQFEAEGREVAIRHRDIDKE
ncbi:MAG: RNase adapter RapZ [candidate division NC10 bacterium]|nr:RNase adapter RapZ [candidate division NC10 bacterium]